MFRTWQEVMSRLKISLWPPKYIYICIYTRWRGEIGGNLLPQVASATGQKPWPAPGSVQVLLKAQKWWQSRGELASHFCLPEVASRLEPLAAVGHVRMSYGTQMNVWCHALERVMSRTKLSHVTHLNESCQKYERLVSTHTTEWVTSHIWMSHVTHLNESRHTSEWVTSHLW
jgi:hypothetical protein